MQASTYCSQSVTIIIVLIQTQKEKAIMAHESYLLNARASPARRAMFTSHAQPKLLFDELIRKWGENRGHHIFNGTLQFVRRQQKWT